MNEDNSSGMSLTDRLGESLQRLEGVIGAFQVRGSHLIPDLVVLGLGRDIFENGNGTHILARSDVPRAGNACARSALEGALDLLFLSTRSDDTYDVWGARARVGELLDRERAAELASRVGPAVGDEPLEDAIEFDAAAMIHDEAAAWESYAVGKGTILLKALEDVREDRRKRRWHWTGYRRTELPRRIYDGGEPDSHEFVAVVESWYNLLSIEAHPAPRIFADQVEMGREGTIQVKVTPESEDDHARMTNVGVGASFVAAEVAGRILTDLIEHTRNGA